MADLSKRSMCTAAAVNQVSGASRPHPAGGARVPMRLGDPTKERIVKPTLSVRIDPDNPNHHLWNNHGTWWLHYTVHPTPHTKRRVRLSLRTRDVVLARERRDLLLGIEGEDGA